MFEFKWDNEETRKASWQIQKSLDPKTRRIVILIFGVFSFSLSFAFAYLLVELICETCNEWKVKII